MVGEEGFDTPAAAFLMYNHFMKTKQKTAVKVKKPTSVKAEIWSLKVCQGTVDKSHGFGRRIREIHLPSLGISMNVVDDRLCCFRENGKSRYDGATLLGCVNFPSRIVDTAVNMLEATDSMNLEKNFIIEACEKSYWRRNARQ
jgi:hypothetical protein